MPSPWSTVSTHPAEQPVFIPTEAGKVSHTEFVKSNIPEANDGHSYVNKYFYGNGHIQTFLCDTPFEREYPVWYGRRYFQWADGAQISVDYEIQANDNEFPANWEEDVKYIPQPDTPRLPTRTRVLRPEEVHQLDDPNSTAPLFISVHGLTGGAHENYVRAAICEVKKATPEVQCAVITTRGCNRSKITTPQLFNGAWTEDLRLYVKHITKTQPKRPIFLAGYSLGGSILGNYLGQEGSDISPQIKSAVIVGCPWDLLVSSKILDSSFFGKHMYGPAMTASLCRLVRNNSKAMEVNPLFTEQKRKLQGIKTMSEFDDIMTAPIFGFEGASDYYRSASAVNRLRTIRVPTLILAAKDDPCCSDAMVPYDESPKNPYTHLITTTYGGHLGWFAQFGSRWYTLVISKYFKSILEKTELGSQAQPPADWKPRARWFKDGRFQITGDSQ